MHSNTKSLNEYFQGVHLEHKYREKLGITRHTIYEEMYSNKYLAAVAGIDAVVNGIAVATVCSDVHSWIAGAIFAGIPAGVSIYFGLRANKIQRNINSMNEEMAQIRQGPKHKGFYSDKDINIYKQ